MLFLFNCVCIALCTNIAHNTAQNRPGNFHSYAADNHNCFDDVYMTERRRVNRKNEFTLHMTLTFAFSKNLPSTSSTWLHRNHGVHLK